MIPLRCCCAPFATVLGLLLWPSAVTAQSLQIQFLDVGQGDATLITTPEGRHVLIDAGRHPRAVAGALRARGIDTLDLVIASHGHADHIGGIPGIMLNTVVLSYVDNGMPDQSGVYRKTKEAVEAEFGLRGPSRPTRDSVGTVRFRFLDLPDDLDRQNNRSVGVVVQFGSFDALFTGDSEFGELDWWLAHDTVPPVEVAKVAHHGSINGTTEEWVAQTRPTLAVISVGKNGYRHPAPNVVSLWSQAGATVLRTDQQGTIEVVADSSGRFRVTTRVGAWPSDSLPRIP
jgi:beta-lactamase superfamily II metal-dependent hydrolase